MNLQSPKNNKNITAYSRRRRYCIRIKKIEEVRRRKGTVRTVAYVRFSSDNQREAPNEAQILAIRRYTKENNQ